MLYCRVSGVGKLYYKHGAPSKVCYSTEGPCVELTTNIGFVCESTGRTGEGPTLNFDQFSPCINSIGCLLEKSHKNEQMKTWIRCGVK